MVTTTRHLTQEHIKFIKWVYENHFTDLVDDERYVVKMAANETKITLKEGYKNKSDYQLRLNEVREKYIKEYTHSITR